MFSANTSQVSGDKLYVEDVFSTYLYTGTGSAQTINNGIELGSAFASGGYITLDGTNYLKSPTSSAFAFGTGDFTMEAWIYPTSVSGTTGVVSTRVDGSGSSAQVFFGVSGGAVLYYANVAISGGTVLANNWYHVACTRSGTTVRIFLDGVQVGSGTDTADKTTTFGFVGAGAGDTDLAQVFKGRISNARFVKGTALYTSNFTPSTTPLTAVSGTSLLTCQSPNLTADNSANAFTLTQVGTVQTTTSGGPFADATKGKGGLVWIKQRNGSSASHHLFDTSRGTGKILFSNSNSGQLTDNATLTAFNSNGFSLGGQVQVNTSGLNFASWTFRKAPKFFDVVTWTGNGVDNGNGELSRTISHSLGVRPGCIIIKRTDTSANWKVTARKSDTTAGVMILNSTSGDQSTDITVLNNGFAGFSSFTATNFGVFSYNGVGDVNASGATYVAYLFAHDTTSDGIIQCGSYTGTNAAGNLQNLGWEPQWVLVKRASGAESWLLSDNMRGVATGGVDAILQPSSSAAEFSTVDYINYRANGFDFSGADGNESGQTYIYIAIRRGPMRTPTSGTSVFSPVAATLTTGQSVTTNFPVDLVINGPRTGTASKYFQDRLRGGAVGSYNYLESTNTSGEITGSATNIGIGFDNNTGLSRGNWWSGDASIWWNFRRAPSFFDVVCYTGTSATNVISHNLGAAPELAIFKQRSSSGPWRTFVDFGATTCKYLALNATDASSTVTYSSSSSVLAQPTATNITIGTLSDMNGSGSTYVAYLLASCPGVSKVGSYTGNGSSQTINCGFDAGARFVLIKRTDAASSWLVMDSARGITSSNDPVLQLNNTIAENSSYDPIDPNSSGFVINNDIWELNINGATYIYLAVA